MLHSMSSALQQDVMIGIKKHIISTMTLLVVVKTINIALKPKSLSRYTSYRLHFLNKQVLQNYSADSQSKKNLTSKSELGAV